MIPTPDDGPFTTRWSSRPSGTPCSLSCLTDGVCDETTGACGGGAIAPGFCAIRGVCAAAGEFHPETPRDPCRVCTPARDPTFWMPRADGTPCDAGDRCRPDGVCATGICRTGPAIVCPAATALCTETVCDPASGACLLVPLNGVSDQKGCAVCHVCREGTCPSPRPAALGCGGELDPCRTCDLTTGACVNLRDGTNCGSPSCTVRRTCVGGQCGGPCQQCDSATGQCVTCAPCCNGVCGATDCGFGCCNTDEVCISGTPTSKVCCPKTRLCNGTCLHDLSHSCCGNNICASSQHSCGDELFGNGKCCPDGTTCCPMLGTIVCCSPTQVCGTFGCIGAA